MRFLRGHTRRAQWLELSDTFIVSDNSTLEVGGWTNNAKRGGTKVRIQLDAEDIERLREKIRPTITSPYLKPRG